MVPERRTRHVGEVKPARDEGAPLLPFLAEQFVVGFTAFMEDVYLDKIQYYSGQDIVLGSERIDPPRLKLQILLAPHLGSLR
jgi:hypothetical protein